ncbi:MAG: helix-turn-helix domain-containing protein [Actinobacteria bacterium]|nr:helix-turn-helix domain-containing protein [Actinomycetota bacterium]
MCRDHYIPGMSSNPLERWIPPDEFGDRVRRIRRTLRISQTEFAARIDEGEKALASWEAGTREPRALVAVAKRIELAFGVPATWILGLDDQTPTPGAPGPGTAASNGEEVSLPRLDSNQQPSD